MIPTVLHFRFISEDLLARREAFSSPTGTCIHASVVFQIEEKVEMPALHLG